MVGAVHDQIRCALDIFNQVHSDRGHLLLDPSADLPGQQQGKQRDQQAGAREKSRKTTARAGASIHRKKPVIPVTPKATRVGDSRLDKEGVKGVDIGDDAAEQIAAAVAIQIGRSLRLYLAVEPDAQGRRAGAGWSRGL